MGIGFIIKFGLKIIKNSKIQKLTKTKKLELKLKNIKININSDFYQICKNLIY